ncbi:MAG TPA: glycosyltransferase, partial [Solirubrobacteraceae bacterium]|nr:glycosyltransferase [Solirubrobacteraceae bacterium]
ALAGEPIEFQLVGGGPLEAELKTRVAELGLRNVTVRPGVTTACVGELMLSCHALLISLNAHPLLADFIPSKLYDAMAVGRAAIVAARGEAAEFVTEHGFGLAIEPQDGAALAQAARLLAGDREYAMRLGAAGKAAAGAFARSAQAARLLELLESIA